jgi:menaquinol-cytochrome c reductase iron-sulfur subunit
MAEESQGHEPVTEAEMTRRGFMFRFGLLFNIVAAGLMALPVIGYVASTLIYRDWQQWIVLGPVDKFPEGQTRLTTYRNPFYVPWSGKVAELPCWVRRQQGDQFQIFAINCTHLGCPVRWFSESGLFMCPCHGGVYYEDGSRASGPPPRGLYQYEYQIKDGKLLIKGGQIPTLTERV